MTARDTVLRNADPDPTVFDHTESEIRANKYVAHLIDFRNSGISVVTLNWHIRHVAHSA
jgi:hypothetical protein